MAIERGPAQPPALRELSTTAIANTLGVSAVDVFVYDTRKDSDGGAWRKKTQNTSWYNETLNTSTRGTRREFPAVAVLVTTSTSLTIYDGDDPDLPGVVRRLARHVDDRRAVPLPPRALPRRCGGLRPGLAPGGVDRALDRRRRRRCRRPRGRHRRVRRHAVARARCRPARTDQ